MENNENEIVLSRFEYAITKHMHETVKPVENFEKMRPITEGEELKQREENIRRTLSRIKVHKEDSINS